MTVFEIELNAWKHANLAMLTRLMAEIAATKPNPTDWLLHFEVDCQDDLKGITFKDDGPDNERVHKAAENVIRACVDTARNRPPT